MPLDRLPPGNRRLYRQFLHTAARTCHRPDAQGRGPVLQNLFGTTQVLQSGERVVVDEAYLRESILRPGATYRSKTVFTFGVLP